MLFELLRPALFQLDPERAHDLAIMALEQSGRCGISRDLLKTQYQLEDPRLSQQLWGLTFANPVGIAAGFDKNARAVAALAALGFGFVEIGTVTPQAQAGNPKPRLFRLPADAAIINRLGFPNEGAQVIAARLARLGPQPVPLGINLGKNKDTALAQAADDYVLALEALFPYGDYAVINVSSPNTPGLRHLQGAEQLAELVAAVQAANQRLATQHQRKALPLLVKLAPDLSEADLQALAQLALQLRLDGLIAGNTTLSREGLQQSSDQAGGLSGQPLRQRSTEVIRILRQAAGAALPIIGVGGVSSGQDAYDKIRAGASLVQLYTSFVYQGPGIARRINTELLALLDAEGYPHISAAIGQH